ncbi:RTA1-domain-containing protein [Periconia macrospinosa]|uniref:RTA1-domain-containing protein n=1 Tax=Periconia macrospinosa TaxID=97972 RepID=A0A2V1DJD1_9PLEO|nr:RTA1-domain-containing protein [Periconia macrospinosa]
MANGEPHDINDTGRFVFYRYEPSIAAAVIFIVLFAITTLLHIYQIIRRRTWYFIPLAVGGIFEAVSYAARVASAKDQWALTPYIVQSLLSLVAPALFAASIYIILGRIILLVDGERFSLVRKTWLTKLFVAGDVLSFLIQGAGGGLQGSSNGKESTTKLGENLIVVGLFVQLAFFGAFVIVSGIFHFRLVRSRHSHSVKIDALPWKRHLVTLYVTGGLILVRSVFRVVEYLQGNAGYLLRHEAYLYVFDALLMFVVMVAFNVVHPSQVTEAWQERQSPQERVAKNWQNRSSKLNVSAVTRAST